MSQFFLEPFKQRKKTLLYIALLNRPFWFRGFVFWVEGVSILLLDSYFKVHRVRAAYTPRKFDIAPTNRQSQKETSLPIINVQGLC